MKNPVAVITMQDGRTMTFELYPDIAPITVNNYADLANSGFYDGLTFHRIKKGWVLHGGSPYATSESPTDFSIKGEFSENGIPNPLSHERGVLSVPHFDHPDSGSYQFFIVHTGAKELDGKYATFGKMIEGFKLLDELADTPTDETPGKFNPPLTPVIMKSVRVTPGDKPLGKPERIIPPAPQDFTGTPRR